MTRRTPRFTLFPYTTLFRSPSARPDPEDPMRNVTTADLTALVARQEARWSQDRKSTRLNSSHANISYAVFCLKKKSDETEINNYGCDIKEAPPADKRQSRTN